jgi:hypothetical protein
MCLTIDLSLWGQSRIYAAKDSRRNSWDSPVATVGHILCPYFSGPR